MEDGKTEDGKNRTHTNVSETLQSLFDVLTICSLFILSSPVFSVVINNSFVCSFYDGYDPIYP